MMLFGVGIAAALTITSAASASTGADLSVAKLSAPPKQAAAGQKFSLAGTVVNDGTSTGSGKVVAKLMRSGSTPAVAGKARLRKVAADGTARFKIRAKAPASLKNGSYSVVACVRAKGTAGHRTCANAPRKLTIGVADYTGPAPQIDESDTGKACVSGARTLGDRDFPEVGNGGYDVQNYDVNINYNNVGNVMNAGTHTAVSAVATQSLCDFSLDFDGLTIDSITVNGVPATWQRVAPPGGAPPCAAPSNPCTGSSAASSIVYPPADGCSPSGRNPDGPLGTRRGCPAMKLVITPAAQIDAGSTFVVDVAYHGVPLRHLDADGTEEGWLNTPNGDGTFNVNEPIGAMTWLPSNNHPADKATYDFHVTIPTFSQNITLPAGTRKIALANGELINYSDNPDSTTTWYWRMGYPMATYLSAVTIGDFDLTQTATRTGVQLYNALDSTFTAAQKNSANSTIAQEETIINALNNHYGRYPFDSNGVVADAAGSIGYVLEVQTKIHFPSSGVGLSTLAHETGHQWFGDSVSTKQWNEIWQNEGWATYTDWLWNANYVTGGQTLAQRFTSNYTAGTGSACPGGTNKWCIAPVDADAEHLFTTFPVYTRGGTMLVALNQILGDTKFFNLARRWQQQYQYGNARTTDFIALAKDIADDAPNGFGQCDLDRLDQFFQQWLYGHSQPTITGTQAIAPGQVFFNGTCG